jgi:hypothetical protein
MAASVGLRHWPWRHRRREGVLGLRRAFQVAGARTVIMSLWSVEDRAAMEWMRLCMTGAFAEDSIQPGGARGERDRAQPAPRSPRDYPSFLLGRIRGVG